ncbi:FMN-binding protein [Streptomyces sp. NY05-11A]|uniref:FMN-binding protein n=1 Tax=Streptomyces soliscabiei TaxID=588897 RepID=UPI0029B94AFF|nr:FMN-binding protein [Streptomyces sp. NY05-11A]MDX2675377.1 FMN-binding protein [Streptomyces sp. NY05-11A]
MRKATAAVLGTAAATTLLTALKLGMPPVGADSTSAATAARAGSEATTGDTAPAPTTPSTGSSATCPAAFTGGGMVEPAAYLAMGNDDGDHGGGDDEDHPDGPSDERGRGNDGREVDEGHDDGQDDDRVVPVPADTSAPAPTGTASPGSPCTKAPAPSAPATGGGLKNGTFKGAPAQNDYGTVQTTVTVSGGRITDVAASFPATPDRSAQINAQAIPVLRQEALAAQSADIDAMSGASFTSASYRQSLQSAIDAATA